MAPFSLFIMHIVLMFVSDVAHGPLIHHTMLDWLVFSDMSIPSQLFHISY